MTKHVFTLTVDYNGQMTKTVSVSSNDLDEAFWMARTGFAGICENNLFYDWTYRSGESLMTTLTVVARTAPGKSQTWIAAKNYTAFIRREELE